MLLAIDTSSRYGGVALANGDGGIVDAHLWRSQFNHTAKLMPAVAATLQSHGLHVADLTGVAVALGPGPFSALRVGVSAAKGLAMAATLPIVGVDSLALEAAPHLVSGCITLAWLDAGRGEVAAGWFGGDGQRTKVDEIAPPADLLEAAAGDQSPRIYCGEAAFGHRDFILASVVEQDGEIPTVHVAPWTPADRLWALVAACSRQIETGETNDLSTVQPYYLRMPSIGTPRQRDRVPQGKSTAVSR